MSVLVGGREGLQVNKFKQVFSDEKQLSVAGSRSTGTLPCDLSHDACACYVPTHPPPNPPVVRMIDRHL